MLTLMSASIAENIVFSWFYIYHLLKRIHEHNWNVISFY